MPMKQLILIQLIILSFFYNLQGQEVYIRPFYSTAAQAFPNFYTTVEMKTIFSVDTTKYRDIYKSNSFSLGQGKWYGVAAGKYFNNNSEGIELGLYYFHGTKQKLISKDEYEFYPLGAYNYTEILTEKHYVRSVNLTALYFRQWNNFPLAPYLKIGGLLSYVMPTADYDLFVLNTMSGYDPGAVRYFYRYDVNNGFVPGLFTSAGIELFAKKTFSVTIEGFLSYQTFKPKSMTCIEYTQDNIDALYSLTPSEREVYFTDTYISTENENPNRPYQLTRRNHSLSGKGLQIGVKYRL